MKYDIANIKDYLTLVHPKLMKGYLWTWIFMASFFGILPAVSDPFTPWIFYSIVPLVILVDIWAALILTDLYKWQKMYILFVGVYCFIMSLIFILISFKFIYYIVGINYSLFAVYAIALYLLILTTGFIFHIKALKNGYYTLKKIGKGNKGVKIIVIFSVIGTIAGKFLIRSTSEQTAMVIFALAFLLFAYILELGINNIHKYYLLKKYKEYINIYPNPKKK